MTDQINTASLKRKKRLLARYGSSCPYCLRPLGLDNMTIDHVIPRATYNLTHHPLREAAIRLKNWFLNKEIAGGERLLVCDLCNRVRNTQSLIKFLKSEYISKHINYVPHKETTQTPASFTASWLSSRR